MKTGSVVHINLLRRTAPARRAALSLAAVLTVTVAALLHHGMGLQRQAAQARSHAEAVQQQLKDLQTRMAVQTGEQAKAAAAQALRKEIDALQPQAQAAQALVEAVRGTDVGRTDEFLRALNATMTVSEPGLWLTAVTVGSTGQRLELKGEARNGASVLRFAHRVNAAVQPLKLRMDALELAPAAATQGPAAPGGTMHFILN